MTGSDNTFFHRIGNSHVIFVLENQHITDNVVVSSASHTIIEGNIFTLLLY